MYNNLKLSIKVTRILSNIKGEEHSIFATLSVEGLHTDVASFGVERWKRRENMIQALALALDTQIDEWIAREWP